MDYFEFKQSILIWRSSLIQAWAFSCKEADRNCAYILLSMAKKLGLTEKADLSGALMKSWPKKREAPSWACSSATVLLIEHQYLPNKDEILASMIFYWLTDNNIQSKDEANISFPKYLLVANEDRVEYWINVFFKK